VIPEIPAMALHLTEVHWTLPSCPNRAASYCSALRDLSAAPGGCGAGGQSVHQRQSIRQRSRSLLDPDCSILRIAQTANIAAAQVKMTGSAWEGFTR
jgi:hypothetical protein